MTAHVKEITKSTTIDWLRYDYDECKLTLHFISTDTYWTYEGVEPEAYRALIGADSLGVKFNEMIRNQYPAKRDFGMLNGTQEPQ